MGAAAEFVLAWAKVPRNGRFFITLSGGTTETLYRALTLPPSSTFD
jgi:hypothetical protein